MFRLVLLIPFLIFAGPVLAQDSNCVQRFRTGTFTYEGKGDQVKVIRTKTTQIERFNDGKSEMVLSIEWPNDSTYVMVHQRSVNAAGCLEKGDTIRTRVLDCQNGRLTGISSSKNCGGKRFQMTIEEE